MAGFKFKFQPVLNLRQQIEDVRKFEMSKAVSLLEEEKDKLNEYERSESMYIQKVSDEVIGGMDLRKIKECNSYLLYMRNVINNQKNAVDAAEEKVLESREKLKTALIEKKTMENLKTRHAEIFAKEQIKAEQLVTDEITSYKYKVKSGE